MQIFAEQWNHWQTKMSRNRHFFWSCTERKRTISVYTYTFTMFICRTIIFNVFPLKKHLLLWLHSLLSEIFPDAEIFKRKEPQIRWPTKTPHKESEFRGWKNMFIPDPPVFFRKTDHLCSSENKLLSALFISSSNHWQNRGSVTYGNKVKICKSKEILFVS